MQTPATLKMFYFMIYAPRRCHRDHKIQFAHTRSMSGNNFDDTLSIKYVSFHTTAYDDIPLLAFRDDGVR